MNIPIHENCFQINNCFFVSIHNRKSRIIINSICTTAFFEQTQIRKKKIYYNISSKRPSVG